MKNLFTRPRLIALAILAALLIAWGIYARPRTALERQPLPDKSACLGVQGSYATAEGQFDFSFEAGSPEFEQLWELVLERDYRSRLENFLPGIARHLYRRDFTWDLRFMFTDRQEGLFNYQPGELIQVRWWYAGLDLFANTGDGVFVTTADQEAWTRQVLEILMEDE